MANAWTRIEQVNGRRIVLVCPKRSYRIPAALKDCKACAYLVKRTQTHIFCGYKKGRQTQGEA